MSHEECDKENLAHDIAQKPAFFARPIPRTHTRVRYPPARSGLLVGGEDKIGAVCERKCEAETQADYYDTKKEKKVFQKKGAR